MTGFAFAYAVVRVCGGQPRKNPGAPRCHFLSDKRHLIINFRLCGMHLVSFLVNIS